MSESAGKGIYLLDTHIVLFAMHESHRLSPVARAAIAKGRNVLSVISYWEVMLKSMKGTLDVGDPRLWWRNALDQLAARPLLLEPAHVQALAGLPDLHRDPFDRILMAQAIAERLTLVSADTDVARYKLPGLCLVG